MRGIWSEADWWEAGLFVGLVLLASVGSWVMARLLRGRLARARSDGAAVVKIEVLKTLVPLLRWGLLLIAVAVGLEMLKLPDAVEYWLGQAVKVALALLAAFVAGRAVWVAFRGWAGHTKDPVEARTRATLAPVLAKSCQVFFYFIAVLLVLQNLGYNVAGLLAGLGIGGLAVALAAKETLANLFGSIAVLVDRPFQVNDFIRIGLTEGTVEKIGLRSTRVRTPEGFLVSIPNQNITTSEVVNLSARPTRREVFTIGLVYDLSAEQMKQAVALLREIVLAHPQTAEVWVNWKSFGNSSLDIQVVYWSKAMAMQDFLAALEELNFAIKEKFDVAGFGFAFPTRTVVLQREGG
ncbi:MAG: mechanosensitive ion channel family protein [Chthoniobacterales bacterium]